MLLFALVACAPDLPGPLGPAPSVTRLAGCPAPPLPAPPASPPTLAENVGATPSLPDREMIRFTTAGRQWVDGSNGWTRLPDGDLDHWRDTFASLPAGDPRGGVLVCVGRSPLGAATRIEVSAGNNPRFASDHQGEPGLPIVAVPGVVLSPGDTVTVELFGGEPRVALGAAAVTVADLSQPLNVRSPEVTAGCRVGPARDRRLTDAVQTLTNIPCDATVDATSRAFGSPYQHSAVRGYAEAAASELGWADPRIQALLAAVDVQERSFAAAAAPLVATLATDLPSEVDVGLFRGTFAYTCDGEPIPGASAPPGACTVVADLVANTTLRIDQTGVYRPGLDLVRRMHTLGLVWDDGTQEFAVPSFVAVAGGTPIQVDNTLTNGVHGPVVVDVASGATFRMVFAPVVRLRDTPPVMVQLLTPGQVVARVRPTR